MLSTAKGKPKKVIKPRPTKGQSFSQAQAQILKKYGPTFEKLAK